ncbi:hypothetical protein E2C01_084685 [Portunus trituberculatus]|uniref:Uncharacterized protein n=1 Tax=Portunus trituberculatus TaxID=210409 RepID=A0A5B7J6W7_PORTR|nr:hypothetical protein [Portunus trituberculatus]
MMDDSSRCRQRACFLVPRPRCLMTRVTAFFRTRFPKAVEITVILRRDDLNLSSAFRHRFNTAIVRKKSTLLIAVSCGEVKIALQGTEEEDDEQEEDEEEEEEEDNRVNKGYKKEVEGGEKKSK